MNVNFSLSANGQTVACTAASQAVAIPTGARDVMVYNAGPNVVRVKTDAVGGAATAASMPILSGEKGAYMLGTGRTHLHLIAPGGNQSVEVFFGEGQ